MKNIKKFLCMLIAMAMTIVSMFSTGIMVSASELANGSITIKAGSANRSFTAYQVFKGKFTTDQNGNSGTLTEIEWGSAVPADKQATLIAALKADTTVGSYFKEVKTADDVAKVLQQDCFNETKTEYSSTAPALMKAVSEIFGDNITKTSDLKSGAGVYSTDESKYFFKINNVPCGYYLVEENVVESLSKDDPNAENSAYAVPETYSKWMLQVVGNSIVEAKVSGRPELAKEISAVIKLKDSERVAEPAKTTAATVALGDTVEFHLTATVPDMTDYKHYQYAIHDQLSDGLDFVEGSVRIEVEGDKDESGEQNVYDSGKYAVTISDSNTKDDVARKDTMKIVFNDFKNEFSKYAEGTKINIYYQATVNDNAFLNSIKEDNEAYLQYSNHPTTTSTGDPDDPDTPNDKGEKGVTGETPKKKAYVYSTYIQIHKVDESGRSLAGAEFTLTSKDGTNIISKVRMENEVVYTEDNTNGTFYKLKSGSYTLVAPDTNTEGQYESATKKYKREIKTTTTKSVTDTNGIVGTVDEGGYLTFTGLADGAYTLTETKVPEGYDAIKSINFTLNFNTNGAADKGYWGYDANNSNMVTFGTIGNGTSTTAITVVVKNVKGSVLPETGGIGTTIFYVFGAILVFAAGILLVTRRRMNAEK
jgi:fimbrial isopeptide formation D2 family protein/LPXTG-motif cell wall-anchored protein